MTRRASTKAAIVATPSVQSPAAEEEAVASETSPAGNTIGCSLDLLAEILIHLPAKSLIRFKCVSKNWLSLISDPQFAGNHSRQNPRPSISGFYLYSRSQLKFVYLYGARNLPSLAFVNVLGRGPIKIADSCNGLLLSEQVDFEGNDFVAQYVVFNVCTQKYRIVPKFSGNLSTRWINHRAFLAFDPSKSPHYKVVLVGHVPPPLYEIRVFSSQSGCWKHVFTQHECHGRGVYWNGAIYWVRHENFYLKFDLDVEEMIAIPNPRTPMLLIQDKIRYLGECGGRLFLMQCCSLGFRILELLGSSWCERYQVHFGPIIVAFPEIKTTFEFDVLSLLCDGNGEKKEDFTLVLAISGRIISYNLHRKTFDVLSGLPRGEFIDRGKNGYAYPIVETLSPV